MRELAHPANELGYRVLIDRHLAFALEDAVEVSAGVIAQPQAVGVQAVGRVGWHIGADTAFQHDGAALAAANILKRREAKLAKRAAGLPLDGDRRGVVGLVVLRRHQEQIGVVLAARLRRHYPIEHADERWWT